MGYSDKEKPTSRYLGEGLIYLDYGTKDERCLGSIVGKTSHWKMKKQWFKYRWRCFKRFFKSS